MPMDRFNSPSNALNRSTNPFLRMFGLGTTPQQQMQERGFQEEQLQTNVARGRAEVKSAAMQKLMAKVATMAQQGMTQSQIMQSIAANPGELIEFMSSPEFNPAELTTVLQSIVTPPVKQTILPQGSIAAEQNQETGKFNGPSATNTQVPQLNTFGEKIGTTYDQRVGNQVIRRGSNLPAPTVPGATPPIPGQVGPQAPDPNTATVLENKADAFDAAGATGKVLETTGGLLGGTISPGIQGTNELVEAKRSALNNMRYAVQNLSGATRLKNQQAKLEDLMPSQGFATDALIEVDKAVNLIKFLNQRQQRATRDFLDQTNSSIKTRQEAQEELKSIKDVRDAYPTLAELEKKRAEIVAGKSKAVDVPSMTGRVIEAIKGAVPKYRSEMNRLTGTGPDLRSMSIPDLKKYADEQGFGPGSPELKAIIDEIYRKQGLSPQGTPNATPPAQ